MKSALLCVFFSVGLVGCDGQVLDDAGGSSPAPDAGTEPHLVGSPNCPSSGGTMVDIPDLSGGSYCIDQTQVTNAAYAAWLATDPSQDLRPTSISGFEGPVGHCRGPSQPTTYVPYFTDPHAVFHTPKWPVDPSLDNYPIVHIDWCDAYAYCTDHGKRLCGKIGGGPMLDRFQDLGDPARSEFHNAVTHGGQLNYPYGTPDPENHVAHDSYIEQACGPDVPNTDGTVVPYTTGKQWLIPSLRPVASLPSCEGAFAGIFDLVGNGAEFVDACFTDTVAHQEFCVTGGALTVFSQEPPHVDESGGLAWGTTAGGTGFRCCADVLTTSP